MGATLLLHTVLPQVSSCSSFFIQRKYTLKHFTTFHNIERLNNMLISNIVLPFHDEIIQEVSRQCASKINIHAQKQNHEIAGLRLLLDQNVQRHTYRLFHSEWLKTFFLL